jgi:hypothetical protein
VGSEILADFEGVLALDFTAGLLLGVLDLEGAGDWERPLLGVGVAFLLEDGAAAGVAAAGYTMIKSK